MILRGVSSSYLRRPVPLRNAVIIGVVLAIVIIAIAIPSGGSGGVVHKVTNLAPSKHVLQHLSSFPTHFKGLGCDETASCEVCVRSPEDPLCEYGIDNIRLSRSYEGSGHRVRKVLAKALRGEVVKIGIIGASVSVGHGLQGKQRWQDRFFEDFKRTFANAELYDGTSAGMNSAFYSYCFETLLPRDLDIYLVELDVNNEALDETFNADDTLYRALLGLPQEPALIRISVFALAFADLARGLVSNLMMSNFFDVPVIGVRNFLLPHVLHEQEKVAGFFAKDYKDEPDLRHIGHVTHRALGDMVALYFRERTCETQRRLKYPPKPAVYPWPSEDYLGGIPRLHMWNQYSPTLVAPPVTPSCLFASSKTQTLVPKEQESKLGWRKEEWNGKAAWTSSEVGALISFEFTGTNVGVFVWQTNGAGNAVKPGRARCWAGDDVRNSVVVDAWTSKQAGTSAWTVVRKGLPYEKSNLWCQIIHETSTDGHDFRILGIASQ